MLMLPVALLRKERAVPSSVLRTCRPSTERPAPYRVPLLLTRTAPAFDALPMIAPDVPSATRDSVGSMSPWLVSVVLRPVSLTAAEPGNPSRGPADWPVGVTSTETSLALLVTVFQFSTDAASLQMMLVPVVVHASAAGMGNNSIARTRQT